MLKNTYILYKTLLLAILLALGNAGYGQGYTFKINQGFSLLGEKSCGEKTFYTIKTKANSQNIVFYFKKNNELLVDFDFDNESTVDFTYGFWNPQNMGTITHSSVAEQFIYYIVMDVSGAKPKITMFDEDTPPICEPTITVNESSLSGFEYCEGVFDNDYKSFTVSGENLTADITVTAPTNYEVSADRWPPFAPSVDLPQTDGKVTDILVAVRLKQDLAAGAYDEGVTISTAGATSKTISLNGDVFSTDDPTPGTINDITICKGVAGGVLTLTGNSGNVVRWESSTDNVNFTEVSHTTETYTLPALTETTYYKAVVRNGNCGSEKSTESATVDVVEPPNGGNVSGVDAVCAEESGSELTLESYTGNVVKWQYSNDNFATDIRDIANAEATYTLPTLTENASYRAVVSNGYCEEYSDVKEVVSNAGPEITSHPSGIRRGVCEGTSFAEAEAVGDVDPFPGVKGGQLYVTANNASKYQWYSNTTKSNEGGKIIDGATSNIFTPQSDTAAELYYYCVVTNSAGCSATSRVSGARTVDKIPEVEASAVATTVYSNGTLKLRGLPDGMSGYFWTKPDGTKWTENRVNQSPLVKETQNMNEPVFELNSGKYVLTVTTHNGCEAKDAVDIEVKKASGYYYIGNGDITDEKSWCSEVEEEKVNGKKTGKIICTNTSTNPANFTNDAQTFIVLKDADATSWTKDWEVSGNGSKVFVGNSFKIRKNNILQDSITEGVLTIPEEYSLKTSEEVFVDVKPGSTLVIENEVVPNLGALSLTSTVEYAATTADQTVQAASYGNLKISGGNSRTVTLEPGTITCSNVFTPNPDCDYVVTDNSFIFDNSGKEGANKNVIQNIPAFTYNNLYAELGGTKKLTGDIVVKNKFRIGQIVKFDPDIYDIEFQGSGDIVTLFGTMLLGKEDATVSYTNSGSTVVSPLPYNNLNLGDGSRVLSDDGVIQIAGTFTPSTGSHTLTGSNVSFIGSSPQTIPEFDFNNLTINSTSTLSLDGNIKVGGVLSLIDGVVTTGDKNFTITNTSAGAVSQGNSESYIKGDFTRNLPADLSRSGAQYLFPVGDGGYLPFTLSSLTTGAKPSVTVSANSSGSGSAGGILTEVSNEYWTVTATGYTNGKVSIGESNLDNSGFNTIAMSKDNNPYESMGGVISDPNINSSFYTSNFTSACFAFGKRDINIKEYSYDCDGGGDVNDISSWEGNPAPSFDDNDAIWVINCDATINADLDFSGANVTLDIRSGATLTVSNSVDFNINGNFINSGTFKTYSGSTTSIAGSSTLNEDSNIENAGILNFVDDVKIWGSTFINKETGTVNIDNADFNYITTDPDNATQPKKIVYPPSIFENYGAFNLNSGNFEVYHIPNIGYPPLNFINATGASITIDNTLAIDKTVSFDGPGVGVVFGEGYVDFQPNSTFTVKNSDVSIVNSTDGNLPSSIKGNIVIEDGNLSTRGAQGGGTLKVELVAGGIYLVDTDNSKDDGIFEFGTSGGGFQVNVEGTLYAEGIQNVLNTSGGSNNFNVKDGATVFVADIGITLPTTNSNGIIVEGGGVLNYCGNLTSSNDDVGEVLDGGTLNYTKGYYSTQNPGEQGDFAVSGTQKATFEDEAACRAAFLAGTPYGESFLPIELIALHGTCLEDGVIDIEWKTLTETNNDYFTVYRSFDGVTFEEVYVQFGAGTTSQVQEYAFTDYVEYSGIVYYKLTQTDFDGTTKVSKIIAVETCSEISSFVISKNGIDVSFLNPNETHVVVITSLMGQILYTKSFSGVYETYIETSNMFTKGLYVVSVYTSTQIKSQKFVK